MSCSSISRQWRCIVTNCWERCSISISSFKFVCWYWWSRSITWRYSMYNVNIRSQISHCFICVNCLTRNIYRFYTWMREYQRSNCRRCRTLKCYFCYIRISKCVITNIRNITWNCQCCYTCSIECICSYCSAASTNCCTSYVCFLSLISQHIVFSYCIHIRAIAIRCIWVIVSSKWNNLIFSRTALTRVIFYNYFLSFFWCNIIPIFSVLRELTLLMTI